MSESIGLFYVTPMPLHVEGNEIQDTQGNPVTIRAGTMNGRDWTLEDFQVMKEIGMNTALFVVWWGRDNKAPSEPSKDQPFVYNEDELMILKEYMQLAELAGLYTMVHVRVCYNPDYTTSGNYPWSGWATNDDVLNNVDDGFGNGIRDRFKAYLTWLLEGLVSEDSFIGIEPWHFPYHQQGDLPQLTYDKFFGEVIPDITQTIRQTTDRIIFTSPIHLGRFDYKTHPGKYSDINMVYNTGGYGVHNRVAAMSDTPWDYGELEQPHKSCLAFKETYNVPMISTEGGGVRQWHPKWGGEENVPQDVWDLFKATMEYCEDIGGWALQFYGDDRDAWGMLLSRNPTTYGIIGEIVKSVIRGEIEMVKVTNDGTDTLTFKVRKIVVTETPYTVSSGESVTVPVATDEELVFE